MPALGPVACPFPKLLHEENVFHVLDVIESAERDRVLACLVGNDLDRAQNQRATFFLVELVHCCEAFHRSAELIFSGAHIMELDEVGDLCWTTGVDPKGRVPNSAALYQVRRTDVTLQHEGILIHDWVSCTVRE
ncbi:hypothetical protein D3C87_1193990 [compost metagenome]